MISVHTTPEKLIYDYRDVIFFENGSVFENVFRPPVKRKAVPFKFHQLKKRFRRIIAEDGPTRRNTAALQNFSVGGWSGPLQLLSYSHTGNYGYCTSNKNSSGAVSDLTADLKMARVHLTGR